MMRLIYWDCPRYGEHCELNQEERKVRQDRAEHGVLVGHVIMFGT